MACLPPTPQNRVVDRLSKRGVAALMLTCGMLLVIATSVPAEAQRAPDLRAYQSRPETLPRLILAQPLPFSHRTHAAEGIECVRCHPDASKKFEAGLPDPGDCLDCHRTVARQAPAIQKLTQLMAADVKIDWVPVYDSPSYVIFSHRKHVRAGEACQTCHGDVTQYDILPQEVSINMTSCMNCHAQRGIDNECFWCHELPGF
jgi:hypothetical protein